MGALEALNGMLLFGLSTAALFAIIQKVLGPQSIGTALMSHIATLLSRRQLHRFTTPT